MCSRKGKWHLALGLLLLPHLFLAINIRDRLELAVSGSNVSLKISSLPESYHSLTWFYTTDQKIVEREHGEPKYFNTKFKGRATLDIQTGALNIYKVQKDDSSTYLLKILYNAGNENEWMVTLMVYDPVPKPVIKIEKAQEMNNCNLTLSCVIQDQPVNYTWYRDSGPFPKELQRSVLEITVTPQNYSQSYTCQVSNPVSSQNNTIYFTSPCKPAPSSGAYWTEAWLVVIVTTVLGLLWT
ncbi:CD48 antigen [Vicugna pacos]|uniref:CD48 antigen n=1 Tax=Vicugna pacos TaxID=30538 RepID=A0A6J0B0V1_VICPA|nr:CD48 antigen [Vicugna pacos]